MLPRLRLAAAFTEQLTTTTANLLDEIYEQLNVGGDMVQATPWCEAYRAERNRSLSVGDVVMIEHRPYSVDGVGWTPIASDKLTAAIAATKGTVALGGGSDAATLTIEPTVVVDPDPAEPLMTDEIFGPILPIVTVANLDEAIKIANDTDYGLSAGVWGGESQALEVARELDAGMVWVNDWHVIHPAYPFGGFKQSGLGRESGREGVHEYVEVKTRYFGGLE